MRSLMSRFEHARSRVGRDADRRLEVAEARRALPRSDLERVRKDVHRPHRDADVLRAENLRADRGRLVAHFVGARREVRETGGNRARDGEDRLGRPSSNRSRRRACGRRDEALRESDDSDRAPAPSRRGAPCSRASVLREGRRHLFAQRMTELPANAVVDHLGRTCLARSRPREPPRSVSARSRGLSKSGFTNVECTIMGVSLARTAVSSAARGGAHGSEPESLSNLDSRAPEDSKNRFA